MTTIYDDIQYANDKPHAIKLGRYKCNECGIVFTAESSQTTTFGTFIPNKSCIYCKHLGVYYIDH
jgi:hypothetical protein